MKKYILPVIITLSAISVSLSAAYYSVTGLSKLFAGAEKEVLIMAGSLEVAKLIIATLLHQYWNTIGKLLRSYLILACGVLMIITSIGIYGFLSSAYQETYAKVKIENNQKQFLESKIGFFRNSLGRVDESIVRIEDNIKQLSSAKTQQIQVRDTSTTSGYRTTVSTAEVRQARKQLEKENIRIEEKEEVRTQLQDSLQKYQSKVLELENNSEQAGELGPLKYLAEVTDTEMSKVINILLLVIIFVFDPLAVSLVICANYAFGKIKKAKPDLKDIKHRGLSEGKTKNEVKEPVTGKTAPPSPKVRNEKVEESSTSPGKPKVINTTKRMEEILNKDGTRKWRPKTEDSNKINYL